MRWGEYYSLYTYIWLPWAAVATGGETDRARSPSVVSAICFGFHPSGASDDGLLVCMCRTRRALPFLPTFFPIHPRRQSVKRALRVLSPVSPFNPAGTPQH